jgi:uncharacterized phage-associated protein
MRFTFDIHRTLAAVGYLCSRNGGKADVLKLVKMLYVADRTALTGWHRTITGDAFVAMDNGPVLSAVYDLIKGKGSAELQQIWGEYVGERVGNNVTLKKMPDESYLSDREIELLKGVFDKIMPMSARDLIRWLHKLPEWEHPKGSSKRIDPRKILKFSTNLTEAQIEAIDEEIAGVNFARRLLHAR